MAANGIVREALRDLDARLDHWRQTLVDLCRIPSVSAAGFPPEEVRRSAQAMAQALRDASVEHVEVLEIPGVHPYVYGDWLHRPGAADDKGGVLAHVAAVGSYLRAARTLPLNVKFIIEGEEEIGSRNLGRFLEQYRC
jgi:acetylornithine deacetylase/succinyl-diaminopimelate desuccinylase-like protein